MIRNLNWYALNATRSYPVDDAASCVDDAGQFLPVGIIADLRLIFPRTLGQFTYIGSVTVTPKIVSVTILASQTTDGGDLSPVAAISLPQPVLPWKTYDLDPQVSGAGGWIVFGGGVATPYRGRFSQCGQTRLNGRAATATAALPVKGMAKMHDSVALTGIVTLKGGNDLVIEAAEETIDDVLRDVIRIRLREPKGVTDNVFDTYRGKCGERPESKNCGDPQPIEAINDVVPDCCGVITLHFKGCAQPAWLRNDRSSAVVDCGVGLGEACGPTDKLPDPTSTPPGQLPNEYEGHC